MPKDILIYLFIHLFYFLLSERETTRDSSPEMEKHTGWLHYCFSLHDFSEKKKRRLWQVKVMFTCISTAIKSNSTNALILIYAGVCLTKLNMTLPSVYLG